MSEELWFSNNYSDLSRQNGQDIGCTHDRAALFAEGQDHFCFSGTKSA